MAWLYCTVHGRGHENFTITRHEEYREAGESVLIVHGTLKSSGPHRCDRCNAAIRKGDAAVLVAAFPRDITEAMDEYDFTNEERYFDVTKADMKRYGAIWPGGEPDALLSRSLVRRAGR